MFIGDLGVFAPIIYRMVHGPHAETDEDGSDAADEDEEDVEGVFGGVAHFLDETGRAARAGIGSLERTGGRTRDGRWCLFASIAD